MDAASWASVFQRIPPDKEDHLVIVTTTGVEIIVQKLIRVDREFVVLKGRLSGATDAARAVLMPYDQINNLAVGKALLEADVLAVFGLGGAAPAAPATKQESTPAAPAEEPAAPATRPERTTSAPSWVQPAPTTPSSRPPSKSIFLQRLRARLGTDSPKPDNA